jgi:thiol-disulfide isomerase/thioredoxin
MQVIISIILSLLLFSCTTNDPAPAYVVLHGELDKMETDSISLTTHPSFLYFEQEKVAYKIPLENGRSFRDTLLLEEGHYQLTLGDKKISLFLKPGYDLQILANNTELKYNGEGMAENYYLRSKDSLVAAVGGKNFYQYYSHLPEKEFLQHAESLEQQRLHLIKKHPGIDPGLEKTEILWAQVEKAHKLHNYSFTRETVDTSYVAGPDYPDAFEKLNVNNEDLLQVSLYPILMYSHYGKIAGDNNLEEWEYIIRDSFPVTNNRIREIALYTTAKFAMNRFEKLDEFYASSRKYIPNPSYWEELTQQYLDLKDLAPEKPAPGFKMKNMEGKEVSLQDFKGKLVYLDFWATSCRPCIEEMPAFNKLQKDFEKEDIAFISIGITSTRQGLERIIKRNDFMGIHLYDPAVEKELETKYAVTGIPRYVLIDKEGKIIDHMAKRPSDPELALQLKEHLR